MSLLQKAWKDPVWSKIIATAITFILGTVLTGLWGLVTGVQWSRPITFQAWQVAATLVLQIVSVLWIGLSMMFGMRPVFRFVSEDAETRTAKKPELKQISENDLAAEVSIRFEFVAKRSYSPKNGDSVWPTTYRDVFRLLGPKLLAEPAEQVVKEAFNRAMAAELEKFEVVHVRDNDLQSLKIKLSAIGVITLNSVQGRLRWGLTEEGKRLLLTMH